MTTTDTTPADSDHCFPEWLKQSGGFQVQILAKGQLTIRAVIHRQLGLACYYAAFQAAIAALLQAGIRPRDLVRSIDEGRR